MPHSDPEIARAVEEFALSLRRARREAGEPSLRELAHRTRPRGSISTFQRAFAGSALPSWDTVDALLRAGLGQPAGQVDAVWRPRWIVVKDLLSPLGGSATSGRSAPVLSLAAATGRRWSA
ncbi:hypothetical protein KCV87_14115 [Actinosynnema pretiosum subsp. pretiosum]|uniref:Helix-turn-helix domain protein n=2 Tax=Actinosynnema TaxID=40566 RepID=C6WRG5_ACTMD|nr:hypothetical protein [Actinosynnema mirum]ACU35217.1 hypothetical protein Amir_1265 [Actinosynnema mirum DSM 43827]AXX28598.1 hypothetical protein APASM_1233 [Actinosynnema pretiosum subsp. pretiosum]QUF07070.1 hypothetical protein KCV87_14115 [Actinosynnema pretiosum subsp. pretiosum]